jgi:hypothetical protein
MPWFRRNRPPDLFDRAIAYDAQEVVDGYEQSLVGLQRAYALPGDGKQTAADLQPVAGVTVQRYAQVCSAIDAAPGGDTRKSSVAQREGLTADAWTRASAEWNTRLLRTSAVAEAFFDAYPVTTVGSGTDQAEGPGTDASQPRQRSGLLGKLGIRGPRAQFETGRRSIQLGTDAKAMWAERQQAQAAMQQEYEAKLHDRSGPDFEPIAGISIEQYGEILRAIEATPDGPSKMVAIAEQHGVAPGTWDEVSNGWIGRSQRNLAVATAMNESYRGI